MNNRLRFKRINNKSNTFSLKCRGSDENQQYSQSGNFMPKATTSAQTASGYGMATREAAVLMTVQTYDAME